MFLAGYFAYMSLKLCRRGNIIFRNVDDISLIKRDYFPDDGLSSHYGVKSLSRVQSMEAEENTTYHIYTLLV
jgi:hypothetical protein